MALVVKPTGLSSKLPEMDWCHADGVMVQYRLVMVVPRASRCVLQGILCGTVFPGCYHRCVFLFASCRVAGWSVFDDYLLISSAGIARCSSNVSASASSEPWKGLDNVHWSAKETFVLEPPPPKSWSGAHGWSGHWGCK